MTTLADIAAAASEFNAKADALQARMDAATPAYIVEGARSQITTSPRNS